MGEGLVRYLATSFEGAHYVFDPPSTPRSRGSVCRADLMRLGDVAALSRCLPTGWLDVRVSAQNSCMPLDWFHRPSRTRGSAAAARRACRSRTNPFPAGSRTSHVERILAVTTSRAAEPRSSLARPSLILQLKTAEPKRGWPQVARKIDRSPASRSRWMMCCSCRSAIPSTQHSPHPLQRDRRVCDLEFEAREFGCVL